MNRHTRIFWGIFCWITVAVCACLAVLNTTATPASEGGAIFFGAFALLMIAPAVWIFRDRSRV